MNNTIKNTTFKISKLVQWMMAGTIAISFAGCGLNEDSAADDHNGVTEYNFAPPTPNAGDEQYSMLSQQKQYWMNAQGEQVSLRGINLGNWLMLEMWMLDNGGNPVGEGIEDQCGFEGTLTERFGAEEKERLMDVYRDNFITERDWDILQDAGYNLIRVPFPYDLVENDAAPMTLRDDAWQYLDYAVAEAKARNMWVILDLHGAAGRQGWEHHSGCAGLNQYWDGDDVAENQQRTKWLWQQIASHYKDEPAIAGYGVLNEPWGTDAATLAANVGELYSAIREIDEQHIVILPGHNSGIDAYGDPADHGMQNVAFEMHFYPGIFGWGEIGYDVHREWLTCGQAGTTGVCEWEARIKELDTPFLIGEMQPWAGLGELAGPITRASFDRYNELGWAGTAWSYKVLTTNGGQGNGTWGYVTNKGERLIAKASTWSCAGWSVTLDQACETPAKIVTPTETDQTFYLVIKSGSLGGVQDIRFDDLQLVAQSSAENVLTNSSFDTAGGWVEWSATNANPEDDNLYAEFGFDGGDGQQVLRISADNGFANGGVYQGVELKGGESYLLSGTFSDNASSDTWAEIYLLPAPPTNGEDVSAASMAKIDLNNSSKQDIEDYFSNMSSIEYEVNQSVFDALTAEQPAAIFNFPKAPKELSLEKTEAGVSLVWLPVAGASYNVYRTTSSGSNYQLVAEGLDSEMYVDSTASDEVTYFYTITADNGEESYRSNEVATAIIFAAIPGTIQAEHFSAQTGFQAENTEDVGGGQNLGYTDAGDTLTYNVEVLAAGEYRLEVRVASSGGSAGMAFSLGEDEIARIAIQDTGGWQAWTTLSTTVTLTAGENTLNITALGGAWNFNWMTFTAN